MGSYRNNGPSFSGMRTFRIFDRTQRQPIIWSNKTMSDFRPEGRTEVNHKPLKLRATPKTKKQAKEIMDARIRKLMQGVRAEHERKIKREEHAVLAAKKAIMAEVRAKNREDRARFREWILFRKIREQSRREEEREKNRMIEALRKAENARRKAETAKRKAEKLHQERMRIRKALAKKADAERVKARARRLQRLLKDIRRKHRK